MTRIRQKLSSILCSGALLACSAAFSANEADESPVLTRHEAMLAGQRLRYVAEAGRIAIRDDKTGKTRGYMYYTAYRLPQGGSGRPLAFVWNGGPGANSALLHFSAVGPRRFDGQRWLDNAQSWLPFTDLVLVDPIGTGFSRPLGPENATAFYGTVADVASFTDFIRSWRTQHHAEAAPIVLAGESWGAGRAANVAYQLEQRGIHVAGALLISGGWGLDANFVAPELRAALPVVDMAATADFHGRGLRQANDTVDAYRARVEQWVRTSYAPALERIDALGDGEREALATALAGFTGLPPAAVDRRTLKLSPRQFRTRLLGDGALPPYIFDMRRTTAPVTASDDVAERYLKQALRYRTDLRYLGMDGEQPANGVPAFRINEHWNYATATLTAAEIDAAVAAAVARGDGPPRLGPPLPGSAEAIALNPRLRVLVVGGLYDSFLPCALGSEIERQLPEPLRQAMQFRCYAGGHAMYLDDTVRQQLASDVRAWLKAIKSPDH